MHWVPNSLRAPYQLALAGVSALLQRSEETAQEIAAMDAVLAVLLRDLEEASTAAPEKSAPVPNKQSAAQLKEKTPVRAALQPVTNLGAAAAPTKAEPTLAEQVGPCKSGSQHSTGS
jgi:hypothetical protein